MFTAVLQTGVVCLFAIDPKKALLSNYYSTLTIAQRSLLLLVSSENSTLSIAGGNTSSALVCIKCPFIIPNNKMYLIS